MTIPELIEYIEKYKRLQTVLKNLDEENVPPTSNMGLEFYFKRYNQERTEIIAKMEEIRNIAIFHEIEDKY